MLPAIVHGGLSAEGRLRGCRRAVPADGMQREGLVAVLVALAWGVVPGSDVRRHAGRDARASGLFLAGDEGGRGAEDGV